MVLAQRMADILGGNEPLRRAPHLVVGFRHVPTRPTLDRGVSLLQRPHATHTKRLND
jgi:hypothetical protein